MARVKLSEYEAKKWLSKELNLPFKGKRLTVETPEADYLPGKSVLKVDQGIKKRAKQGLLTISLTPGVIRAFVTEKSRQGHSQFILEPFVEHEQTEEKYLSLARVREGIEILYSDKGGIEIEGNWDKVKKTLNEFSHPNPVLERFVRNLLVFFDNNYLSTLEINPLVLKKDKVEILDLAVEVDDAALSLTPLSRSGITPVPELNLSQSEKAIKKLDNNTPASLKYRLINKDGAIWMLLSGGGASLVLADEVADLGFGQKLGNYGEYSGNPTTEDTYLYTKVILGDLIASRTSKKVLIIGGGVANFTDIVKTFKGVIQALEEKKVELKKQGIKVFVRRGGPNQEKGLAVMQRFLEKSGLLGEVMGPDQVLTHVIEVALSSL